MAYNSSIQSSRVEEILKDGDRNTGYNSVTTLSSLPVTKRLVLATLSRATNISLSGNMEVGQELYIVITPTGTFSQPIPSTGYWTAVGESPIQVTNGMRTEISILCTAPGYYSISAKSEE